MTHLKDFTSSIRKQKDLDPTLQRWLYGTRELESQLSQRVINLCLHYERLPDKAVSSFADLLIEVLQGSDLEESLLPLSRLTERISAFADTLHQSGDPLCSKKAESIRNAMRDRLRSED